MKMNEIFPHDWLKRFVSNSAAGGKNARGTQTLLSIPSSLFIGGPKIGNNQAHWRSLLGKEGRLVQQISFSEAIWPKAKVQSSVGG